MVITLLHVVYYCIDRAEKGRIIVVGKHYTAARRKHCLTRVIAGTPRKIIDLLYAPETRARNARYILIKRINGNIK